MWNEWVLRWLMVISLVSQVVLILLGNLRKYSPRTRIRIFLWCAYLLANAVASAALGIITRSASDVCDSSHSNSQVGKLNTNELTSFWAPFLLLHLGGPDTITAYSLADNELWLRHLAELVFQGGVAIYIFLLAWPGCSQLPLLSILVYVVGFIKCFERIQALRLANNENLRNSMLGSADPGPNYPKFMEDFDLKRSQGFNVKVEEVPEPPLPANDYTYPDGRGKVISEAYDLFQNFKRLFVDLILTFEDRDSSQSYFRHLSSVEAFHAIEIELAFAYDMLYTKAYVVYTFMGMILRLISVFFIPLVLVGFVSVCDIYDYHIIDIAITYLLIAAAVLMELCAVIVMLRSDWTDHWLNLHNKTREVFIFPFLKQQKKSRWSNSMAQLNLLSLALEEKPAAFSQIETLFGIDQCRVKHRYKTYSQVSDDLKDLIYKQFDKFLDCTSDPRALCSHKGSLSLRENKCDDALLWSIKVEFDQSILLWHLATDICYYMEFDNTGPVEVVDIHCKESKHISDYMLYLLVTYPVMLPIGIGLIRYRDTCAEAVRFFKEKGLISRKAEISGKAEACQKLLQVDSTTVLPSKVKGDRCKSVVFDACRLAIALRKMEPERMWKVICQVWVEILAHAATHCRGFHHEQQLRKGGEFLTHVWLLMAHLGITEQFQVAHGHARARLNVE